MELKKLLAAGGTSVALHGLTLGIRFLFFVALAREIEPDQYGLFGLVAATILIGVQVVGADFYIFGTRELVRNETSRHAVLLRDQVVFHGLVYLVVLPVVVSVFFADILPFRLMLPFYVLLVLEHIAQELRRILIAVSRPIAANVGLFLRMGSWTAILLGAMALPGIDIRLETVIHAWIAGVALSVVYGAAMLSGLNWRAALATPVDWAWLREGARTSAVVFLATVAARVIELGDRYFLKAWLGDAAVGVYTFYYQLAFVAQTLTATGLLMILYPGLVRAFENSDHAAFRDIVRRMVIGTAAALAAMAVLMLVAVDWVVAFVERDEFTSQAGLFYWMLVLIGVATFGTIPHLVLYSQRRHAVIVWTVVPSAVLALAANAWLVPRYGLTGAVGATLVATSAWTLLRTGAALAGAPPRPTAGT